MPSIFEQSERQSPDVQIDLAGQLLKYLLTNLPKGAIPESEWAPGDKDWKKKGVLRKFYQTEFLDTYMW